MTILDERDFAHVGSKTASLRAEDVLASQEFRKFYETLPNVVTRGGDAVRALRRRADQASRPSTR